MARNGEWQRHHGNHCRQSLAAGQGPSSYWMQDPAVVFEALRLEPGTVFLDLGCGTGATLFTPQASLAPTVSFTRWIGRTRPSNDCVEPPATAGMTTYMQLPPIS